MFEISVPRSIKANMEFVFNWWTDLSPGDVELVKPLKKRQILSKTPDLILLGDEEQLYFRKMMFDVTVRIERPSKWISEYKGKVARARSEYALKTEADDSATLFYSTRIEPKGIFTKTFSFLLTPFVRRVFVGKVDVFIDCLEKNFVIGNNLLPLVRIAYLFSQYKLVLDFWRLRGEFERPSCS
ncbi:MAG: hypothetical protein OK457_05015 [Thaumarchaeota archaeon]|nr:hypothetical protein [Nitrososphaerota archaeon]